MPGHGGNRTYDLWLWNTSPMLCQLSYAVRSVRVLYFILTKSIRLVYFLTHDRFYILSIKAHVIFPTTANNSIRRARNVEISLYFSGSCIPTNESLFIVLALPALDLLQVSLSLSYRSTIVYITRRSTERRSEKDRLVNFGKSRFKTEPKMQDLL